MKEEEAESVRVRTAAEESISSALNSPDTEKNQQESSDEQFSIPDGGYGWVNVGAFFFTCFCCWGGNAGFSIYLAEYIKQNLFHSKPIDYAAVGGLAFGAGFLFAPSITYAVGRVGPNIVMAIGSFLQLAAMLLASFSTKIWQLYLTQGVLMGFGLAFVAAPVPPIIPQWFSKRRSLAMGLGSGGSGFGGLVFNLGMQKITEVYSVRWALRAQAIICVVINLSCSFLIRTRGHKIKVEFKPFDLQVTKLLSFWLMASWVTFAMFGYVLVQYCLSDATRTLGYSAYQGSISAALLNVGVIFGRPLAGYFADKIGSLTTATIVYLLCGVFALAMWIPCRNLATIYAFSIIEGSLMGYIWGGIGAIIPRVVGIRKAGVSFGMLWIAIAVSGIVSPIIGLSLKTPLPDGVLVYKKQYQWAALFAGVSFLLSGLSMLFLRGYIIARDLREEEDADPDNPNGLFVLLPFSEMIQNCTVINPVKIV